MRIVAGSARGRKLAVPAQGTRPTAERTREAIFSRLQAAFDLDGAWVLDLFAGTGSLGLEALSRGAEHAVFVEKSRGAAHALTKNVEAVGLGGKVIVAGATQFLSTFEPDQPFDVVFLDPPYGVDIVKIINKLMHTSLLAPDACIVAEYGTGTGPAQWPSELEVYSEKRYGDSTVMIAFVALSENGEPALEYLDQTGTVEA